MISEVDIRDWEDTFVPKITAEQAKKALKCMDDPRWDIMGNHREVLQEFIKQVEEAQKAGVPKLFQSWEMINGPS